MGLVVWRQRGACARGAWAAGERAAVKFKCGVRRNGPTRCRRSRMPTRSYDTASRQELLKAMQITDILNVRPGDARACARVAAECMGSEHTRAAMLTGVHTTCCSSPAHAWAQQHASPMPKPARRMLTCARHMRLVGSSPLLPAASTSVFTRSTDGAQLRAAVQEHVQLPHRVRRAARV